MLLWLERWGLREASSHLAQLQRPLQRRTRLHLSTSVLRKQCSWESQVCLVVLASFASNSLE